jgi:hypothetical protein
MRVTCWKCGEEVEYRYFDKPKDATCDCCHRPIFRQLGAFESLYGAAASVASTAVIYLTEAFFPDAAFWAMLILPLTVLGLLLLLQPLVRRAAYGLWVRRYDATGEERGKRAVSCWKCGKPVAYFTGENLGEVKCACCGAETFSAVDGWNTGLHIFAVLALAAGMIGVSCLWIDWLEDQTHYILLMLAYVGLTSLLTLPEERIERRNYLRWLERYRAGDAKAVEKVTEREKERQAIEKTKAAIDQRPQP